MSPIIMPGSCCAARCFACRCGCDTRHIPRVTYCHPELASVGLSEERGARERPARSRVLRWPYAENDRAQAERETEGFVKLVTDRKGRILGVTIVGAQAGDLIVPWCMAVQKRHGGQGHGGAGLPLSDPVGGLQAGGGVVLRAAGVKAAIRRLIGFLRRFG